MKALIFLLLLCFAVPAAAGTYKASDFACLDSDVIKGGGTDDTEALQKILDKALTEAPVVLIMDGAALISGLIIHDNTTVICINQSCGFFMKNKSGNALFRNGRASYSTPPDKWNRNISFIGGTYNHNGANQDHTVLSNESDKKVYMDLQGNPSSLKDVKAMELYGVENLLIKDLTLMNQTTFALLTANFKYVTIENVNIVLKDYKYANNQDGLHFWGPGQFLSIRNVTGTSGDDFIAIAPDERDGVSSISDVSIDGIHLNNADQGIRLLCREKGRLDRVLIKNVTGTFRGLGFIVTPWMEGSGGNYGNIVFDTIDLRCDSKQYDPDPMLFRIAGNIEDITVKNVHYHGALAHDLMQIGGSYTGEGQGTAAMPSDIRNLTLENIYIHNDTNTHEYVKIRGRARRLNIRNVQLLGCSADSSFISCLNPECAADTEIISGFISDGAKLRK